MNYDFAKWNDFVYSLFYRTCYQQLYVYSICRWTKWGFPPPTTLFQSFTIMFVPFAFATGQIVCSMFFLPFQIFYKIKYSFGLNISPRMLRICVIFFHEICNIKFGFPIKIKLAGALFRMHFEPGKVYPAYGHENNERAFKIFITTWPPEINFLPSIQKCAFVPNSVLKLELKSCQRQMKFRKVNRPTPEIIPKKKHHAIHFSHFF